MSAYNIPEDQFRSLVYELRYDNFTPQEIAQLLVVGEDEVIAEIKRRGREVEFTHPMDESFWLMMYICAAEGMHHQGTYPKELQNNICQLIAGKFFRNESAMAETRRRMRNPIWFGIERSMLVWRIENLFLSTNARMAIQSAGLTHVWQLADMEAHQIKTKFGKDTSEEVFTALRTYNILCGGNYGDELRARFTAICAQ